MEQRLAQPQSKREPRSVIEPDADAYDEMIRKHRANAAARESGETGVETASSIPQQPVTKPIADAFKFAREGRAQWEEGQHVEGAAHAAAGLGNLIVTVDTLDGLAKGGLKIGGPMAWRTKPWEEAGARKWLGDKGFLERGQHGHHALIPNNGWGKAIPDWIKNQPFNIKGMEDAVQHGRIHGRYKGLPQFNALQRYWYGTPQWWKAMNASLIGGAIEGSNKLPRPNTEFDPLRFPKGAL